MSQKTIVQQQEKLKQLLSKRHQLFSNIRSITKQQRLIAHHQNRQDDDYTGTVRKMIKKNQDESQDNSLKKIQSKSSIKHQEQKSQLQSPQKQKSKEQKDPENNPAMKQRNKRMFNGLNMYLKKASSRLDSEKEKLKHKIEIQESLIQKKKKQDEMFKEKKNKKLEEQRLEANKLKDQNAKQILECQNLLLRTKYSNYVNQLYPFIMTKTQPHIFWKPTKQNENTKKLREQTKQQLTKKQNMINETIGQYSELFNLGKFLAQNQQEYASNFYQRYTKNLQKNILTKTTPHIYWRPGSWNQKLTEAQKASIQALVQEKSKVMAEFKQSFKNQQQNNYIMHQQSSQHSHEQSQ